MMVPSWPGRGSGGWAKGVFSTLLVCRLRWFRGPSRFHRKDFSKPAPVPLLAAEPGRHERDDELSGQLGPDDPPPQAQHVHVVMLDALAGGKGVVTYGGTNAADLVRGHRGPDVAEYAPAGARRPRSIALGVTILGQPNSRKPKHYVVLYFI